MTLTVRTQSRRERGHRAVATGLLAVLMAAAACGSQRTDAEIEAAAIGGAAANSGTGVASRGATVTTLPGDVTVDPGALAGATTGGTAGGSTSGAVIGATGGPTGSSGPATGTPIIIGNVGDYAGIPGAAVGNVPATLQGWAQWLNANGGINGRPVQVVVGNAGNDPSKNASLVRDFVENRGVVAFVGNQVPLSITGSLKYLEENKIPAIGGDMVASQWNQSPMFFPQGSGVRTLFTGLARVAAATGLKKAAVIFCGEADFVCGNGKRVLVDDGAMRDAGLEVVYAQQISLAQVDFTAECQIAQQKGAQLLFVLNASTGIPSVARSCSQQGYKPQYVTGSLAVSTALANDPLLEGMLAPQQWFPWIAADTPATQQYQQVLATYAPDIVSSPDAASAWVSAQLFAAAARAAGPKVTSASLLDGLYSLRGDTLGGLTVPLTFPRNAPTPAQDCYFAVQIKGGKWVAPQGSKLTCN
jgi:branched-chain amino acid transport system substrate-binding protein